jgi:hypothetical protein
MEGLFYEQQPLIRNDDGEVVAVLVGGPITTWDEGETGASVEATISKGGVEAHGRTTAFIPTDASSWWFQVPVDAGALEPGEADATAIAHIRRGDETHRHQWSQKVELVFYE